MKQRRKPLENPELLKKQKLEDKNCHVMLLNKITTVFLTKLGQLVSCAGLRDAVILFISNGFSLGGFIAFVLNLILPFETSDGTAADVHLNNDDIQSLKQSQHAI
jgi:xanthine/uracil permease